MAQGNEPEDPKSGTDDEEKILQMLRGGFEITHVLQRNALVTDHGVDAAANVEEDQA